MQRFGLALHPVKTRLLESGRRVALRHRRRGGDKPETFNFLGFTHYCGWTRAGWFRVKRLTMARRLRSKLSELRVELMHRRHQPIPDQGKWLGSVMRGHCQYFGVPFNIDAVQRFRFQAMRLWQRALSRRSQKGSFAGRGWSASSSVGFPEPVSVTLTLINGLAG